MKGGWIWFSAVMAMALSFMLSQIFVEGLLNDSDTAAILAKIAEPHSVAKWFTSDWPLENGFYRPISTLLFELDQAISPNNPAQFLFTNKLLVAIGIVCSYWLGCELFQNRPKGFVVALLMFVWVSVAVWPTLVVGGLAVVAAMGYLLVAILAFIKNGKARPPLVQVLCAIFAVGFLAWLTIPAIPPLGWRTAYWIPGRTATSMSVFGITCVASFLRYIHQTANPAPEGPIDAYYRPKTRASSVHLGGRFPVGWLALSFATCMAAMMCYEQAVVLPFLILSCLFWLRLRGITPAIWPLFVFFGILGWYIWARNNYLPVSWGTTYQKQQFRAGPGTIGYLLKYIFPSFPSLQSLYYQLTTSLTLLLEGALWAALGHVFSNIALWRGTENRWKVPAVALLLAVIAFAPMAPLSFFAHYHFFPAAFFAVFWVAAFESLSPFLTTAVSLRAVQAPARLHPAPGSLRRL
jgi:hypothetical protein